MIAKAIAMVTAKSKNGSDQIGTAFPVGESYVITARHIVWDEANESLCSDIEVCWVSVKEDGAGRKDEKFGTTRTVTLKHDLGEYLDVVLLECLVPEEFHHFFALSTVLPKTHEAWETFGYAGVYAHRNALQRAPANGTLAAVAGDESRLLCSYERGPDDHHAWCGMSGAPICNGQSVLAVAIEVEDPARRNNTFHATSIAWLLEHDNDFRSLVLPPLDEEILGRAEQILEGNAEARCRLKQAASNHGLCFKPDRECIEKLIRVPVAELVRIVRDAQNSMRQQAGSGVATLGKFLATLLPLTLDDVNVQHIRSGKKQGTIGVVRMSRHATTISAEMLMARADLRAACFRLKHSDAGDPFSQPQVDASMYALDLPPEAGDDPNKYTASTATDLYQRFGGDVRASTEGVAHHLYRSLLPQFGRVYEDPDKIIRLVNDHLRELMMEGEPVYYWVLDDSPERESSRPRPEWLYAISKTFPSLALVVLAGDFDCDQKERSAYRFLWKIEGLAEA
jgi:hypothetical protein